MRILNILLLVIIILISFGCAANTPITRVEYVKVEIPVVYTLERPTRPRFIKQSTPGYLSELITYTELLEGIIDGHRNKGEKTK